MWTSAYRTAKARSKLILPNILDVIKVWRLVDAVHLTTGFRLVAPASCRWSNTRLVECMVDVGVDGCRVVRAVRTRATSWLFRNHRHLCVLRFAVYLVVRSFHLFNIALRLYIGVILLCFYCATLMQLICTAQNLPSPSVCPSVCHIASKRQSPSSSNQYCDFL